MTAALVLVACFGVLVVIVGRMLRRQKVLAALLVVQSDLADYWAGLMVGMTRIRLDFGDDEAMAWLDAEVADSEATFRDLMARNEKLIDQL